MAVGFQLLSGSVERCCTFSILKRGLKFDFISAWFGWFFPVSPGTRFEKKCWDVLLSGTTTCIICSLAKHSFLQTSANLGEQMESSEAVQIGAVQIVGLQACLLKKMVGFGAEDEVKIMTRLS
jgi:hypothetical protein